MADGSNSTRSDAIVIISSDEDEEEDVHELFREFVSRVERYVEQNNVVIFLKLKFAEARPEFVSSAKFKSALKWRSTQMNKSNGFIYTGDICKLLAGDSKKDDSKKEVDCGERVFVDHDPSPAGNSDDAIESSRSRAEGDVNKQIVHVTIDNCEEDGSTAVVEEIPAEIADPRPSTSTAQPSTSVKVEGKIKKKGKLHGAAASPSKPGPSKKPLTPRKRKRLVKNLNLKLKHVSDQIKILNQAELSLEEMDMSNSTYIQECRLKERFNRIWDKICKLNGRPPDTGRVIEKEIKCPTTGIPEIDRAVNKFLKEKKNRFPDKFDVNNVVLAANKKHALKLPAQTLNEISDEVFMCIGNKLQKRRKRDFEFNFGCSLTDDYHPSKDPAINDLALRKKLDENKKKSKRALDDVFNKFTHYGRMTNHDDRSSSSDSDSEESKSEHSKKATMKRKFSHISVAQASDSSDNECDNFGLEEEADDDNKPFKSEEVFGDRSAAQKHFEGKSKKNSSIVKLFSVNSESDSEDFVMKSPRQVIERKGHAENNNKHDAINGTALPSKETNQSTNFTVVELPNSILSEIECDDISVEHTPVVEIDCTPQRTEIETISEANSSKKDDVANVSEDHKIPSVQHVPPSDVASKPLQDSDAWTDSNVSTQSKDSLTTESADISVPPQQPQAVTGNDLISIDDCEDKLEDLSDKAAGSPSSNFVDSQVVVEKTPNENGRHQILPNSVSSMKGKAVDIKLSPSISIPLTPVSLKGQKSPFRLSTKKRKAENGLMEYESPLKVFRAATKEILERKQEASLNKTDSTEQKTSCNGNITTESESAELSAAVNNNTDSPPAHATTNGHSAVKKDVSRRLALSLNKGGRNSPSSKQKVVERTSDVIVLSDDDSDS
ncbi:hypothetical protein ACROYT_G003000 [Oculina patagonica]